MPVKFLEGRAWLNTKNYKNNLLDELKILNLDKNLEFYGDFVFCKDFENSKRIENSSQVFWHKNELTKPFIANFTSITEAAKILRSIQRNWSLYSTANFRRASLIQEKLPHINTKPKNFPYSVPISPMGIWTLLDNNTIFGSPITSSPFPSGTIEFVENKIDPPSRAYLKLYEALTWVDYLQRKKLEKSKGSGNKHDFPNNLCFPKQNSKCVDAGASPGGWTWVLDQLGASITSIDRSELSTNLMQKPNIEFIKHDAFTLSPQDLGKQDWVFSDVICYPPRLLKWIEQWITSGLCKNFICSIKMQGRADFETTKKFANLPNSHIVHLNTNKHELTCIIMLD